VKEPEMKTVMIKHRYCQTAQMFQNMFQEGFLSNACFYDRGAKLYSKFKPD